MAVYHQLILFLWKGSLFRKRHFIMTFFEIVIPLLLVILLAYFRSLVGPIDMSLSPSNSKQHNATFYDVENVFDSYLGQTTVIYTSKNPEQDKLMEESVSLLKQKETYYRDIIIKKVDNEDQVLTFYLRGSTNDSTEKFVGIIFHDPEDNLNDSLKYEIRMSGDFETNRKYSSYVTAGPRYQSGYGYKLFMTWQAAIDQSFAKLRQEAEEKELQPKQMTLSLLRFPYPPYISNSQQLTFIFFVPTMVVNGLIFMMPFFVKRIIDEKACRAKELMRMMGLSDVVYFFGTFGNTFVIGLIFASITTILFKINFVKGAAVLDYCDGSLFWVLMVLFMANSLIFCMFISAFFNKAVIGAIFTVVLWIASFSVPTTIIDPPSMSTDFVHLSLSVKLATCLLPGCALHWACRIISMFEGTKSAATWGKLFQTALPEDSFNLGMVFGMMLASCLLYAFLFWYVDNVWPWQVGIPKNPGFLFMPSYWCPSRKVMNLNSDETDDYSLNKKHFEDLPPDQPKGIVLKQVSKEFGWGSARKLVVDNVSLSMLKGQITVLLGHNGAGKTTTMNVLTGILKPSSGTALIDGFDILQSTKEARSSLGLCPQHNVLYDTLTVEEHLKFFAGLKGMWFSQFPAEVTNTLKMLDLEAKRRSLSQELSGGMKRKLSLGIAMIANSKVLILDEPTSGLDPQARRGVWDMLQSIRHDRTILLTTHYMEEADVLGDRIAIMAEGSVKCCGSPFFLKKAFGAGYHLRMSKGNNFNLSTLTTLVQNHVADTYIDSDSPTEVVFVLPVQDTNSFSPLFDNLEQNQSSLGYNSCGLSITTMEDVFLKVGSLAEIDTVVPEKPIQTNVEREGLLSDDTPTRLTGIKLTYQKIYGLIMKRFNDARRYWAFLLFQIVLPCIMIAAMLHILGLIDGSGVSNTIPLTLNIGKVFQQTEGLFGGNFTEQYKDFNDTYHATLQDYQVNPVWADDPLKNITEIGENNLNLYKYQYLIGGWINETVSGDALNLTALYNGEPYHTKAMTMNVMDTAWLRYITKSNATITTINHPFPSTSIFISYSGQDLQIRIMFAVFLPLSLSFLSASFVLFIIHERVTKSKLIQRMTGLGGLLFWGCHFAWDYLMVVLASALILIPFVAVDPIVYGSNDGILGVLFVMLLMYGWSAIPFAYILSFIGKKPSTGFVIANSISFFIGLLLNLAIGIYKAAFQNLKEGSTNPDDLAWAFRLLPDFAITWGLTNLHSVGVYNSMCRKINPVILEAICPVLDPSKESYYLPCCPAEYCKDVCFKRKEYLTFDAESCGRDLLFMALSGFIYFGLLVALETNFVRYWYHLKKYIKGLRSVKPANFELSQLQLNGTAATVTVEDQDVAAERAHVDELCNRKETSVTALTVQNLTKSFKSLRAVDNLSFTVKNSECFGLLGVNGAGKTTTFSMLTGDLIIDEGNAFIKTVNVKDNLLEFQQFIGYCPQFDALLDRMTGREALTLFARLRGIPSKDINGYVNAMISMTDLSAHADKIAEKYSGGTRRKLSLGISIIGSPQIVFLDEPTAGVDPSSRRKIWKALLNVQNSGTSSFILTTHSMEECEALCGRLAIMVNGQFRCLGPIQSLKSKYGQGYTIMLKLKKPEIAVDPQQEEAYLLALKNHMNGTFFNIALKDFHQGMLHYHLMDPTVQWSHLFREMEKAKYFFQLEDYLISDTTLEQIFLAFARTQRIVAS